MIRLHDPECCCTTCERLGLGILAYRAISDELGSDDPTVIDPIWRERCQARVDAYNQALRAAAESAAVSDRPLPSLALLFSAHMRQAA